MARLHRTVTAALVTATAAAQTLIAIDGTRAISRIDPLTGAKVVFATASASTVITASLTYDSLADAVYLSSTANDRLYRLDVNTGVATLIGPYGDDSVIMHGIEYDASTDTVYGASGGGLGSGANNHFYRIDKNTGAATQVGNTGLTGYTNLAYDPFSDTMYACNADTDSLYTIDRAHGTATSIGPLNGPTNPSGMALHPVTGVLYLIDNVVQALFTVDKVSGNATLIGPTGGGNLLGLAWVPRTGTYTLFGGGCAGTLGVPGNQVVNAANCGSSFAVQLTNMPFDAAVFLLGFSNTTSGLGPLPLDLGPLGAVGCLLRVSPDILTFVVGAPGSGAATFAATIPDLPAAFVGLRLHTQGLVFDTANAFGFVLSDAGTAVIGV